MLPQLKYLSPVNPDSGERSVTPSQPEIHSHRSPESPDRGARSATPLQSPRNKSWMPTKAVSGDRSVTPVDIRTRRRSPVNPARGDRLVTRVRLLRSKLLRLTRDERRPKSERPAALLLRPKTSSADRAEIGARSAAEVKRVPASNAVRPVSVEISNREEDGLSQNKP